MTNENKPNAAPLSSIGKTDELFSHEKLPVLFQGIRVGEPFLQSQSKYIVSAQKGDIAEIVYDRDGKDWMIYVDNFPGKKQYYKTNFPITTALQFQHEMKRVGIDLLPSARLSALSEGKTETKESDMVDFLHYVLNLEGGSSRAVSKSLCEDYYKQFKNKIA